MFERIRARRFQRERDSDPADRGGRVATAERTDPRVGNGYPDELRADEIPLGARILAVADAVDAMTSDRPYRAARTFEYAKTEILKGSATHFDPEVVTAFIKSQRAIEDLLRNAAGEEMHHHPDSDDLGGWRMLRRRHCGDR